MNVRIFAPGQQAARPGATLVWVVFLMFALLPLMTLIVHLGMVTLTRRQMQTAVNAAALEGLRGRDDENLDDETNRRERVRDLVAAIYDDDLNPENGDAMQFGAGPLIDIEGGVELGDSNFRGLTRVSVPEVHAHKPELQLNLSNEVQGDMVAGQFDLTESDHAESSNYMRMDFDATSPSELSNRDYKAFLVRLRRSGEDFTEGIRTAGSRIPFLFGRGLYGGTEFLNSRERGTIVRATAIASAVPAMAAGTYSADASYGTAPLAIELDSWNSMEDSVPIAVTVSGSTLASGLTGGFVNDRLWNVGNEVALAGDPPDGSWTGERYLPIYVQLSTLKLVVVGFGVAHVELDSSGGTMERLPSKIAPRNASASWRGRLSALSNAELQEFLLKRAEFAEEGSPLLVPALVRSVP